VAEVRFVPLPSLREGGEMSLDATRWAWKQSVSPSQKLVLLSLADRAGESHECHPSIARLEADTGLYRETIMEAISDLEKLQIISVSRKQGCGNRYQLLGVDDRHNQSVKADQYGKADQSEKADHTSLEKPTTTSREKPTLNLPIESTKNLKEKNTAFDALGYLVSMGVDRSISADWISLRRTKKSPATKTAIEGIQREAAKARIALSDALAMCCERGWVGFKADWVQSQQSNLPTGYQAQKEINDTATLRAIGLSRSPSNFREVIEGSLA
jgi:hypothetical protein